MCFVINIISWIHGLRGFGHFFFVFISQTKSISYLELLHAGHVVAEHAILQQGDGVTLAADLLDLLSCAVAERAKKGAGML